MKQVFEWVTDFSEGVTSVQLLKAPVFVSINGLTGYLFTKSSMQRVLLAFDFAFCLLSRAHCFTRVVTAVHVSSYWCLCQLCSRFFSQISASASRAS